MNTYDVIIDTDQQLKGTRIHTIIHARDHEEAMDQALLVHGLDYRAVEKIVVNPRLSQARAKAAADQGEQR